MFSRGVPGDLVPQKSDRAGERSGALGAVVGGALLVLVVVAGLFGSQVSAANPANYLVWLYFWPGVAILVLLVGDFWSLVNPWRTLSALILRSDSTAVRAFGVWPAVAAFAAFVWFDLASGLSDRPRALAIAVMLFTAFVLLPVAFAGVRWIASAEPFGLVLAAVGQKSLPSLLGHNARPDYGEAGWDRFVLYSLPPAAAVFDAVVATPQWVTIAARFGGSAGLERGGLTFMTARTAGLAITGLCFAALVLAVAAMVGLRKGLARQANRIALVTLPLTVGLMAAHNLPALLRLGPQLPAVLGAFVGGHSAGASVSPVAPIAVNLDSPIWTAEVAGLILGLLWSGWAAWRELGTAGASPIDRFAIAYPAWVMLALTSGAGLLILYQPAAALMPR